MADGIKIYEYKTMKKLAQRLRDDLNNNDFVLLYAYNGTGKTRSSVAFKDDWKRKNKGSRDTLYFNAYTEDLFSWDNDLKGDTNIKLMINHASHFFDGFEGNALEGRIEKYLRRYARFDFRIDYENWRVGFYHGDSGYIKISRGEENIFIWCVYLAMCELAIEKTEAYKWVKYFYIDDPVSSPDDNNVITIACDLAKILLKGKDRIKTVISSHHGLFFNVMSNELKKAGHKKYFLRCDRKEYVEKTGEAEKLKYEEIYSPHATGDMPFLHHVFTLWGLITASKDDRLYTYHFNMLRSILEKTASFFGYNDFSACVRGISHAVLYSRALNLLSHDKFSPYMPSEMMQDTKRLFRDILNAFLERYEFSLPEYAKEVKP